MCFEADLVKHLSFQNPTIHSLYRIPWFDYLTERIIHRFWATYRKVLDKNRLDLMASRLRIRQSNRKREIETRSHLSR